MMQDKTNEWMEQIDQITERFLEAFGSLSVEHMNRKPTTDKWSIAENIQHLIQLNESYYPQINQIKNGHWQSPFTAKIPFIPIILGNLLLKTVAPQQRYKTKTFSIWKPDSSDISDRILENFTQHQQSLKKMIQRCSDLLRAGQIVSSPANRFVVYRIDQAFDIMIAHEQRHLQQALCVKSLIQSEKSADTRK